MSLSRIMPGVRRFASEPLPQFIAIGLALFAIAHVSDRLRQRPEIRVDAAQRDYQRNQFRGQFGADPDAARLADLLQAYVRDEALYREALRLGLDRDDEIIRRRLIQKMEFLAAEGAALPAPTPEELATWHAAHASDFTQPGTTDFEQRYFADNGAVSGKPKAEAALARLRQGGKAEGEVFAAGERFVAMDHAEARKLFGDTALVAALATTPVGRWEGPFQSGYGWHLLRITARSEARKVPLAEVESEVREGWLRDAREKASAERIAALVKRYRVTQADGEHRP